MKILITLLGLVVANQALPSGQTNLDELLINGNDKFSSKLFSEVAKKNKGKSVVLSGFSLLSPLAELALASDKSSHDQILTTIALPKDDESVKDIFIASNKNFDKLNKQNDFTLKQASRIYITKKAKLNKEFEPVAKNVFQSEVKSVDFSKTEETAKDINTWVEGQTNNRIKDLVSANELSEATTAVLVNALYFKGKWVKPFEPKNTQDRDFFVSKNNKVKVPMMNKYEDTDYAESDKLKAKLLTMPYSGGASLLIILPNEVDGMPALLEKLKDPEAIPNAMKSMSRYSVNISLPKFKIETTTDLKDALTEIGIKELFGTPSLTKLIDGNEEVIVSSAKQKAFIEVNEEGAEAAAANEFHIVATSLVIYPTASFDASRPFVYMIKDKNNVLFSGIYYS